MKSLITGARLLLASVLMLIGTQAFAGEEWRAVPRDGTGTPIHSSSVSGCKILVSTGATTSIVIATGRGLLYSIDTSSSAGSTGVDTYLVLRDSATVNSAQSTWLIPPIVFGGIGGTHLSWTTPLRFVNGLQWQVALATSTVTIGYTLDGDR